MGLAICKRLVERMGGDISVTSRPQRGSVFRFSCIVVAASCADLLDALPPSVDVRPMDILLAEDNPVNRMIVKVGLEQRHHRVTEAENGVRACELAARRRFDIVLMDMQMPVMDGTEATRRIRALPPPLCQVPIIALTADALTDHRAAYMEAGLTAFLTKPIEWPEVDALLARHCVEQPTAPAQARGIGYEHLALIDGVRLPAVKSIMTPAEFDEFVRELDRYVTEEVLSLQTALQRRDLAAIGRIAHDIKGMFGNIGGVRVGAIAKTLQACDDIAAAKNHIEGLVVSITETLAELKPHVGQGDA